MNRVSKLLKGFILSIVIVNCMGYAASGQNTPAAPLTATVIDTGAKAVVFAPGVVSTRYTEWATSFTPDGKTVYFSQGAIYWTICFSKMIDGKWARPQVANISGRWMDTDPFITPDGKRMFFISNRPLAGMPQDKHQPDYHIWYADKLTGDEWSAPKHIAAPVNIEGISNYAPSVSNSGTLFFCSRDREGHGGMASYCAKWLGDHYDKPQLLLLNGKDDTQDPFIAPDESYLIFVSGNDIFISYKQGNDWSAARKLGSPVNNGDSNSSPCVSPDGKMLYYSSGRIQGFYKRNPTAHALNYDELLIEMQSMFNSQSNILVIPVNLSNKS